MSAPAIGSRYYKRGTGFREVTVLDVIDPNGKARVVYRFADTAGRGEVPLAKFNREFAPVPKRG